MSDVLHYAHTTPTQAAINARHQRWFTPKPIPVVEIKTPDAAETRRLSLLNRIEPLRATLSRLESELEVITGKRGPMIRDIQRAVCTHYDLTHRQLIGDSRMVALVRPRQVSMYLSKTLTVHGLAEVARRHGGRDHTTCLHAVRRIDALRVINPKLDADVETLAKLFEVAP